MSKKRLIYGMVAFLLFLSEVLIALYCKPGFIRSYFGDVLVTVLLCALARVVFTKSLWVSPIVLAFSVLVEWMQYLHLATLLGVEDTVLGIIIGTTFSWLDILCYLSGCVIFSSSEYVVYYILNQKHRS